MATPPAFQWYPGEVEALTSAYTLSEAGGYMRLLNHQWAHGSVPGDDARALSRILRCTVSTARSVWQVVGRHFPLTPAGHQNARLEEERARQAEWRRRQVEKGKAGAAGRWQKDAVDDGTGNGTGNGTGLSGPVPKQWPDDGSSSSVCSTEGAKNAPSDARARGPSLVLSPLEWDKLHGKHVEGFCDWVCLPQFVALEFAAKALHPGDIGPIVTWARGVRVEHEPRGTVGDDSLTFWRKRWAQAHQAPPAKAAGAWTRAQALPPVCGKCKTAPAERHGDYCAECRAQAGLGA